MREISIYNLYLLSFCLHVLQQCIRDFREMLKYRLARKIMVQRNENQNKVDPNKLQDNRIDSYRPEENFSI
jgi:hypothetical protein